MFGFPGLFVYATQWSQPKVDLVYVSLLPRIRVLTRLQFPVQLQEHHSKKWSRKFLISILSLAPIDCFDIVNFLTASCEVFLLRSSNTGLPWGCHSSALVNFGFFSRQRLCLVLTYHVTTPRANIKSGSNRGFQASRLGNPHE